MQNKILVVLALAVVIVLTFFSVRSWDRYKLDRVNAAQATARVQEQEYENTAKYQQSLIDSATRLRAECLKGKTKVATLNCQ